MKTAHIIYNNYLTPNGEEMSLGGVQTYLTNLMQVLKKNGYVSIIYQRGDIDFEKNIDENIKICGCHLNSTKVQLGKILYAKAQKQIDSERGDILIFGSDLLAVRTDRKVPVIAIQHGIMWDVPEEHTGGNFLLRYLKKQYQAWHVAQRIRFSNHLVCVDCNFINWYKALVPWPQVSLHYIPNFSALPVEPIKKPRIDKGINIIFARRFFPKRGTRLFMHVAECLLSEYENINITIAGEGPDERLLRDHLEQNSRVKFIRYKSQDSQIIHADKHIAVVPTLGSEGTSLSLLEAMSCGCAVVCTIVGGMTNIVIDEYNGLLIMPNEKELHSALKRLIENDSEREAIASKAYETVSKSFSLEKWQNSWEKLIQNL